MNFTKFEELEICNELQFAIQDMGFENPTAVQAAVIPLIIEKKDVLATAPTGTGKTCAFGIPTIEKIDKLLDKTQALVVCPTRELAMQITEELKRLTKHIPEIRTISVYGGENIGKQLAHLRRKPQIVVGTPGRIMDHLRRRTLKLDMLTTLILDEADEMLNMGFREDIDVIAKACPKYRQTVLFSATMPKEIQLISQSYQTNPETVTIERKNEDMPKIKQIGIRATNSNKDEKLIELLNEVDFNLAVIFSNTKRRVDKLKGILKDNDYRCDGLHSDIRQNVRTKIMKRFRGGEIEVLIATDVAARGIDVENVDLIINYDLPMDEEYYVHRIGRTGRAKKEGVAYSFYYKDEIIRMNKYAKVTGGAISLDPDDVIENIDDYSVRTGKIMQPRKKSKGKGRNRTEIRGKLPEDMEVENAEKQKAEKRERKQRDNESRDKKPRDNNNQKPKSDKPYKERGEKGEKSDRNERLQKRPHQIATYESFEKPERAERAERAPREDRRPRQDRQQREDRRPREDRAERSERNRDGFERRKENKSRDFENKAPRRERKENIDSYGERAPKRKTEEFKKKDMTFKPKQGKAGGGKGTTFAGKKTTKKHDKRAGKKK